MGLNVFRVVHPRLLLAGLFVLIGFGALFTSATAQDDVEPEATTVESEAPVDDLATPEAGAGDDTEAAGGDAAVAALLDTGSGSGDGSTAVVLTASALAAATLGLAAIGARRMIGRNEA
ncbi:MAG: hypothetical protein M3490_07695 [Chloroflexota bacterium]|nr:hypothetical protein [Chloroflexota bacterium]